jgi:hypothetical protein
MFLLSLQVFLPLLLIAAVAFGGRHRVLKVVQILAAGLLILVAQSAGLWLLAPRWTAWLLWFLLGFAVWVGWRRTLRQARLGVPSTLGLIVASLAAWRSRHQLE